MVVGYINYIAIILFLQRIDCITLAITGIVPALSIQTHCGRAESSQVVIV